LRQLLFRVEVGIVAALVAYSSWATIRGIANVIGAIAPW
jgi:hypothetical protein